MRAAALLCLLPSLWACSGLPEVREVTPEDRPALAAGCRVPYPQGAWTVVHSIQVRLPGGGRSTLVGVSASIPLEDRLESVLLSPEGIVLFEASRQAGEIKVARALPPLDRDGFAQGLFSDVRFLFFPPAGELVLVGRTVSGGAVCRYQWGNRTEDLLPTPAGGWIRREYADNTLRRQVTSDQPNASGFASSLELIVYGLGNYRMSFHRLTEPESGPDSEPEPAL